MPTNLTQILAKNWDVQSLFLRKFCQTMFSSAFVYAKLLILAGR